MKYSIKFLTLLLLLSLQTMKAQDILQLNDETSLNIKITKETAEFIKYTRQDVGNLDTFSIQISSVTITKLDSIHKKININKAVATNTPPINTDSSYIFIMNDGSKMTGKLISKTDSTISIESPTFGKVTLRIKNITDQQQLNSNNFVDGQYWYPNSNSTRYFFSPSALNLKAGEGYYQNSYLFFNSFFVGITNNISIGGGFELLELFINNSDGTTYFLNVKAGGEIADNVHLGGGIFFLGIPDGGRSGHPLIPYGLATFGNENNNLTVGAGVNYSGFILDKHPAFTISGMARASKSIAFVSENWVIPEANTAIISYGIRFLGERISVDLGFINNSDIVKLIPIGIPYVDFVVKF